MKKIVLFINDFYTTEDEMEMICYGLGSCVGLFIQDRSLNIASGAHISVAKSYTHTGFKTTGNIFLSMLSQLAEKGSDLKNLRAKIVGGASIYESSFKIGQENVTAIKEFLITNRVFIAAEDTGGNVGRTALFHSGTGDLTVQTASKQKYII